ncbi:MAG: hypothetical protein WD315_02360 [Balneolaceae bacterium]
MHQSSLTVGWEIAEFVYTGDDNVSDRSDFDDGIFRVRFENPGLDMYLGLAGGLTGMENQTYLNVGAILYNDFILSRMSDSSFLLLPLQINTDLTRSQRSNTGQQFQQSAFMFGAGLGFSTKISNSIHMLVKGVPNYGFSFSQGSLFGGSVFKLQGKSRLFIQNLFSERSLVLGYDYHFSKYDVDGEIFDYDFNGHSVTVGITF